MNKIYINSLSAVVYILVFSQLICYEKSEAQWAFLPPTAGLALPQKATLPTSPYIEGLALPKPSPTPPPPANCGNADLQCYFKSAPGQPDIIPPIINGACFADGLCCYTTSRHDCCACKNFYSQYGMPYRIYKWSCQNMVPGCGADGGWFDCWPGMCDF